LHDDRVGHLAQVVQAGAFGNGTVAHIAEPKAQKKMR